MAFDEQAFNEKLSDIKKKEQEAVAKKLADKLGLRYLNLLITPINPEDLKILSRQKAKEAQVLVLRKLTNRISLAIIDPDNPYAKEIIKSFKKQGLTVDLFIASQRGFNYALNKYDALKIKSVPIRGLLTITADEIKQFDKALKTVQDLKGSLGDLSTSAILKVVLTGAIKMGASDIHVEPEKDGIRLRYRVDGMLEDVADLPERIYRFLISRIKNLSGMLLNITEVSQDGRFSVKIEGLDDADRKKFGIREESIDLRVSILPSGYGESVVMRLLGVSSIGELNLDNLNIRPEFLAIIKNQIKKPNGMILTTGPTGSGKTTTLYSCLNFVNEAGTKIITVEDPIEYRLEGVTQTQIDKRKGQDFAMSLKSIVRQDPDILLVGEIRDRESAEIATQFALTGHLVFSTLHTNEAAGAIPRMTTMGVRPDGIASALNLLIAQRLIRKLCPDCKAKYNPSKQEADNINNILKSIPKTNKIPVPDKISAIYKAKGCDKCHGIGYKGRVGVFELLEVTDEIKKLALDRAASFEIQRTAQNQGMIILMQDAILRLLEGVTSIEEIERVIGPLETK